MRLWIFGVATIVSAAAACAPTRSAPSVSNRSIAVASMRASPYDTAPPNLQMAQGLMGCYQLTVGPWSDSAANGGNIPMPARVHLDTTRTARPFPGFAFVATTPGFELRRNSGRSPVWSPIGADSLQVLVWSTGTSSVTLFVRRGPKMLQGTARYFTDGIVLDPVTKRWLWEQYPSAPVQLTSLPCA
jgi:hypothetical protein